MSLIHDMRRALCVVTAFVLLASPGFARAQSHRPLRVCADPDYMPYSDRAGYLPERKAASPVWVRPLFVVTVRQNISRSEN